MTIHRPLLATFVLTLLFPLVAEPAAADPGESSLEEARDAGAAEPGAEAPVEPLDPSRLRWIFGRTPAIYRKDPDAVATRVGGWLDASFQDNDLAGEEFSLSLNHVNVYLDTRYRQRWQLFIEAEYEHETDHSGFERDREFELEQVYLKFTQSDPLTVRIGRFNTPFGYWIPIHWAILMDTIEKPVLDGAHLVPEQQIGVDVAGRFFPKERLDVDTEIDYSLYLGYGADGLRQDNEGLSLGADLRLLLNQRYTLGASVYRQKRDETDRTEESLDLYWNLQLPHGVTFRSEYVYQHRNRTPGSRIERDIEVAYAKLRWDFLKSAYANYRFSYGDDDDFGQTDDQVIQTFTIGLNPYSSIHAKLEYSSHEFRGGGREDFNFWALAVGYLF